MIMEQACIPEGCVPPACCPYLPACTALGGLLRGLVPASGPGGGLPLVRGMPASGLGGACLWSRGGGGCVSQHVWKHNLVPTSLQAVIIPGKIMEWPATMRPAALWIALLVCWWQGHNNFGPKQICPRHLVLDLDDLVRINRVWLYKDPKVSVLQANVKLV